MKENITSVKTEPTLFTYEMRRIALENIEKYDWARQMRDEAVSRAEGLLKDVDVLYSLAMREGIPRSRQLGYNGVGNYGDCRICGVNVHGKHGGGETGGFNLDHIGHPYKIQCKECNHWFPTNDFGSFYKLGLDENGKFDYDKAWEENDKLIASGHPGYLVNELYPEKGKYWGVDDGFGAREYKDGSAYHKYIPNDSNLDKAKSAVYMPLWSFMYWKDVQTRVAAFTYAYLYTGDIKYARAGAMLLDRTADVVSEYCNRNYTINDYLTYCGGTGNGIFIGRIHDPFFSADMAKGADAFFPMLDDAELIEKLSAKAKEYGLKNDKSSREKIWKNWRDNQMAPTLIRANAGHLKGNYGIAERCVAINALVLAEEPLSSEMMAWIYKANTAKHNLEANGGNFNAQMINVIDRDGFGNEGSPMYNCIWLRDLSEMADKMAQYKENKAYNPFTHPKFVQMFLNYEPLVQADYYTSHIGDDGSLAGGSITIGLGQDTYLYVWNNLKDTPLAKVIAQHIYASRRGKIDDLKYNIFTENPESLKDDILAHIDTSAKKESKLLSGYGYATLKDGCSDNKESLRGIWTFFGMNHHHGHQDTLNLGMNAFGLNLAPEIGYPIATINDPTNGGFIRTTVAHNTVVVDKISQYWKKRTADPYIFDDSDKVKLVGVEAKDAYYFNDPEQAAYMKPRGWGDRPFHRVTDSYNRMVMMVKVDEINSYYVDFFRILGGTHHTYSFHSQSHEATPVSGLNLVKQIDENGNYVGTYAGVDIARGGKGEFPIGHNYFTKVRRDTAVESNRFCVDFKVTDYQKFLQDGENIHLKMTQINNFVPDEVAVVGGYVLEKRSNEMILAQTDTLDYVLSQHESKNGEKLDSLYTTVFEPYRKDAYLQDIEELSVTVVDGTPKDTDVAKALLITHKNGRKDYIFYATNKEVTYRVADLFNIRGYAGVYSVGEAPFRYVVGGNYIGEAAEKTGVYKGKILDFSKNLTLFGNFLDVDLDEAVAPELAGRYIYIENDGVQNCVYRIETATPIDGGVRLDLGTVSLVRAMQDVRDNNAGYIYNVAQDQKFEIPMANITNL